MARYTGLKNLYVKGNIALAGWAAGALRKGSITTASLNTAAGSTVDVDVSETYFSTSTLSWANVYLGTSTAGLAQVVGVTPAIGKITVKIKNIHGADAFNGTLKIDVLSWVPAT